jgi:hypothetical protein
VITHLRLSTDRLQKICARPGVRSLLLAAPLVALVTIFTVSGLRGVDFGDHWDEVDWQIHPVRDMVASGLLLPRATIYPSMTKWLVLLPAVPAALRDFFFRGQDPHRVQQSMTAAIDAPAYLLTVRRLFVVVCALAIVWVYAAVLAFRRNWWEAFIAAAGVGLSWEYAYHARWVATDSILVQFSALTLLMLALLHRTRRTGWLYAAAVAAGLATSTKYPGAMLLAPVFLSSVFSLPTSKVAAQAWRVVALGALAVGTYLLVSPSTVLEPFGFIEKTRWIASYYRTVHHAGHWVPSAWKHWEVVFEYLALAYFSPFRTLAVPWFASAILGAVLWLRRDWRSGVVVISFPIAFLVFFCFTNLVVIVRNYLLIGPFLAVLAARGIAEIFERLPAGWPRRALAGLLALLLGIQAVWLLRAGESIRHYDQAAYVKSALAYVAEHPKIRFSLSKMVRANAGRQRLILPPNVVTVAEAQSIVFFAIAEGPGSWSFKTNDPWQIQAVFGPREINFEWYCGWLGRDRVIVMPIDKARATKVPLGP